MLRGRSLRTIAKRAGLHNAHLSLILRGKRGISIEVAERLASALRVSYSELAAAVPAVKKAQPARRLRQKKGPSS